MSKEQGLILIADDESYGRDTLEILLAHESYQLIFAENGEQTLEQVKAHKPDLVLLDVMMPEMDGFEVCKHVRDDPELSEIPILLITALDDQDSRLRGLEVGADDFISKPFNRLELRTRIKTITRLNRYRRLVSERQQFQWVVEQAKEGYLRIDAQNKICYANKSARNHLHLTLDTLLDANLLSLLQQYYQCEPPEAWENWPAPSTQPRYLLQPETAYSQSEWLQLEILPNQEDSGHQLIRIRDVTEEVNLRQRAWSFQSLVSHKLRTPLSGISALQLARLKLGRIPNIPEEIGELLDMVERNETRLQNEIMDILTYIDAPSLSAYSFGQGCSMKEVSEIVSRLRIKADLHLPNIESNVQLPLSHHGVKLILQELLDNASKFHPEGKAQIDIEVQHCPDDERIFMIVKDDGIHLSADQLARVWRPYYQGEKFFTGETAGMGLGLPTVASLIQSVGGHCRMENRRDKVGVQVILDIPVFNSEPSNPMIWE